MGRYALVDYTGSDNNPCGTCELFTLCKGNRNDSLKDNNQSDDEIDDLIIECIGSYNITIQYFEK